ncbi:MAG: hypothetical protein JWO45_41, partial [Spartobacteria bacterium]|nr:hypothetical protein [Spartobacteria bacterium]
QAAPLALMMSGSRRNSLPSRSESPIHQTDVLGSWSAILYKLRWMLLSDRYGRLRETVRVRERALFPRVPTELELQARWFTGDFGTSFTSTAGEKIDLVQFGTWNREAGPDFREAVIRINRGEPIRGCIEIDLIDRSWESHGHAIDPAFEETVLHVFVEKGERDFFSRTKSNRNVPQIQIDPAGLPEAFIDSILLARPGRCQAPLKDLPENRVRSILDAAAQFRLRKKAASISMKMEHHGRDEVIFQEFAGALGYKENKFPFTLLAQRLSLRFLRENSRDAEPLLFGLAGFLDSPDLGVYQGAARSYLRDLWDRWWPHRDGMQRMILPAKTWRFSGTRPVNHPQRRLAALSVVARDWAAFLRAITRGEPKSVESYFYAIDHSFWKFHYTLTSEPTPKEMALIGESRSAEIIANVLFPLWLSQDIDIWADYAALPSRLSNRRLETAATRLFGNDPRRTDFLGTVANQQAMLQIYEDFCLQDDSDCAHCPFPEQMRNWV